jgi:hypothetical protein
LAKLREECEPNLPVRADDKPRRKGGRPRKVDPIKVVRWRRRNKASIAATAKHFGVCKRTVANAGAAWIAARDVWRAEQIGRADELTAYVEARAAAQLTALRELLEDGEDDERWENR